MMQSPLKKQPISAQRGCLRRYGGGPRSLMRLVCFPWAGGGASAYRRFSFQLPETIELLAVQYPGREDRYRECPLLRMELIVNHVLDDLIPIFDRPLVFFGHSMGALVAYEVAQALKAKLCREPRMLIISGSGSPDREGSYERCASMASEEEFIDDIQRFGGTPHEIVDDRQMMRALLPVLRADYEVLDTYACRPATPLSCPLIACAGNQDPSVSREAMEAWQQYTTGPSQVHWFSGGHFYLCSQLRALTQCLQEWIALVRPI